jgi:hypothetical protein
LALQFQTTEAYSGLDLTRVQPNRQFREGKKKDYAANWTQQINILRRYIVNTINLEYIKVLCQRVSSGIRKLITETVFT